MAEEKETMKIEGDSVIFSTGKAKYANCGVIGLDHGLCVSHGYDGGFYDPNLRDDDEETLTSAEQIELADYMIALWNQFKERAKHG